MRLVRPNFLSVLILVSLLSFSIRIGDFLVGVQGVGDALAQQEESAAEGDAAADNADESGGVIILGDEDEFQGMESEQDIMDEDNPLTDWVDPVNDDIEFSDVQVQLYKDLAERREVIEQREQELLMREALLEAAERELEQKMRELTAVQGEIEKMLDKQDAENERRMQSLVKIYEGMKAKDAARIFNTLDLYILVDVLMNMSERKSAPIIAAMNADRARTVTLMLAQEKQMPALSR